MKSIKISSMVLMALVICFACTSYKFDSKPAVKSIYDVKINALDGKPLDLNQFKGKKLLVVNVASKCGFTKQYKGLQELADKYKDQLAIVGVPCNQFMGQEPGEASEIAAFCKKNYGVTFQMTEKVDVKGKDQHPLYSWLTDKSKNGSSDSKVKWNFQKYLISSTGQLEAVFMPAVEPMSDELTSKI